MGRASRLNGRRGLKRACRLRDVTRAAPGGIQYVRICAGSQKESADRSFVAGRRDHQGRLSLLVPRVEVVASVDVQLDCALGASQNRQSKKSA